MIEKIFVNILLILTFLDYLFPDENGFNTTFLLKVMSGEKKVR